MKYIISTLTLAAITLTGCADNNYYYQRNPQPIIPDNYTRFRNDQKTSVDTVIFSGLYNPKGVPNGTGTNLLYRLPFLAILPSSLAPSSLTGTSWVGQTISPLSPKLKLTFKSATMLEIQLDCYYSSGNVLGTSAGVNIAIALSENTVYFTDVFQIKNVSNSDQNTFCAFELGTAYMTFSANTGSATVTTKGGVSLGTFTTQ